MSNQLQISGAAKIRTIQGPVVANSGVISALDGDASQYVRGDGTLADFPTSTGGGSSVSYYLNTSVSQGTIGGVAYKQLSKVPISGAGTDVTISANGYIASYITDANDPALLEVPAGNFNCEFYFSVNSDAHNPYVYAELYKYDGTTFTLLGSNQAIPEYLTNGTTLSAYYFAIPVATAVLTITDRIAIRIYVNVDGRTVTLHTENNHLCQVVTTFSKGLTTLNSLTRQVQFFGTGTSGTDFAISSSVATHTFNLPVASAANTGKLSSTDWSTFNGKVPYTGATASVDLGLYSLFANDLYANGNGTNNANLYLKQGISSLVIQNGYSNILATGTKIGFQVAISAVAAYYADLQFSSLTAQRTYTLPDASGTLALLESTQTFSGTNTFTQNLQLDGNGSNAGTLLLKSNTVMPVAIGYSSINSNANIINLITYVSATKNAALDLSGLSDNITRTFTFPNVSGTIALTSDLSGYVTLATAQTITAQKSFSGGVLINSGSILLQNGVNATTTGYTGFGVSTSGTTDGFRLYFGNGNNSGFNFNNASTYTYTFPSLTGTIALGTGTTNYVSKWTGTNTIGNSLIWDNGTNVGINTASPVTTNLVGSQTIVKSYNSDTPTSTTAQTYYTNQSNLYLFGRNAGLSIISNSTNEEGTIFFGNASTVAYASISTGSGTSSVGGDMYFKVGSNTERMRITSGGNIGMPTTYGFTTSNAANLYIDSGAGLLYRSTSSIKYKTNIEDITIDTTDLLSKMRPIWYRSLGDADRKDWSWYGFIAEELALIEPRLVHFGYGKDSYEEIEIKDEEGNIKTESKLKENAIKDEPDGVQYERITVLLVAEMQKMNQTIEQLSKQNEELSNRLIKLESK